MSRPLMYEASSAKADYVSADKVEFRVRRKEEGEGIIVEVQRRAGYPTRRELYKKCWIVTNTLV